MTGQAVDIIELIMIDHRRIRRLCKTLQDTARRADDPGLGRVPGYVWQRLSDLLTAHFEAEEEICHLPMIRAAPQAGEQRREMVADHDDIRETIAEASLRDVGSAPWWRAVRAAVAASAEHLHQEERGVLANDLSRLEWGQRQMLGRQWSAYRAARALDSAAWLPRRIRDGGPFS